MADYDKALKFFTRFSGLEQLNRRSTHKISDVAEAYERVPGYRRCVDISTSAVSSVPMRLYEGDNEAEWPFAITPSALLRQIAFMVYLYGFAVIYKVSDRFQVLDLKVLNSHYITIEHVGYDDDLNPINKFEFRDSWGRVVDTFDSEQVIYIKEPNPTDDVQPGKSVGYTALEAARLMHYQTRFGADYFEAGAMPTVHVKVPQGTSEDEQKRIKSFLERVRGGIRRGVSRILPTTGELEFNVLTPTPDKLAYPDLSSFARQQLAQAFGIPQTMLEDSANRATREQDDLTFWQTTIKPRVLSIVAAHNEQLFAESGLEWRAVFEEMDVFQEDEHQRSSSLLNIVHSMVAARQAGIPVQAAMSILGYEIPEAAQDLLALPQPIEGADNSIVVSDGEAPKKATREQVFGYHIELGVVTKNEARESLGFDPVEDPEGKELSELSRKLAVMIDARNANIPANIAAELVGLNNLASELPDSIAPASFDGKTIQAVIVDPAVVELGKWKNFYLKRLENGRLPKRDFVATHIDQYHPALKATLIAQLEDERDPMVAEMIFDDARQFLEHNHSHA